MEQRNCALCAKPFASGSAVRIYCSRKCGRRVSNANMRGTAPRPPVGPFDCVTCGVHCVPGENVSPNASKFCGRQCKRRWHQPPPQPKQPKPDGWMPRRKRERLASAQRKLDRASAGTTCRWPRTFYGCTCHDCGQSFTHTFLAMYCSPVCRRRADRRRRDMRKRDAYVADVHRADVFERDRWRCQLCGCKVDRNKVAPHPKSPTIDHIIPISKGGTHEPANVQLACWSCNCLIKRDNIGGAGDQLRLIG